MKLSKEDLVVYYKFNENKKDIKSISQKLKVNYYWLKYKFKLIKFYGVDWFLKQKRKWFCIHDKIKYISLFEQSKLDYDDFCVIYGFYSNQTLKIWMNKKEIILQNENLEIKNDKQEILMKFENLKEENKKLKKKIKELQDENEVYKIREELYQKLQALEKK